MAYNTLLDTSGTNIKGDTLNVVVEKDGRSGSAPVFSPNLAPGYTIEPGDMASDVLTPRVSLAAQIDLAVADAALLTELRGIAQGGAYDYRVRIVENGTTEFTGYAVQSATTTPRNDNRTARVQLRAKDRLKALSDDWVDDTNTAFDGYDTYATVLSRLLSRLALGLPIEVVMDWRPGTMTGADDPLSMQIPQQAFYRKENPDDSNSALRAMSAGKVLDDILTNWNCVLIQHRGVWKMHQPAAFASGATVDVWRYAADGTFQQQTTRPASVAVTTEAWETGSDRVSGKAPVRDSRITYKHGAPDVIDFDGSMEALPGGWTFYENGTSQVSLGGTFREIRTPEQVYDEQAALEIEGVNTPDSSTPLSSFPSLASHYAEYDLGTLSAGAEPMTLTLRTKGRLTDGSGGLPVVTPDASRGYWALGGPAPSGTTYWYLPGQGWMEDANIGTHEHKVEFASRDISWAFYRKVDHQIPAPPEGVDLSLRLYTHVARKPTGDSDPGPPQPPDDDLPPTGGGDPPGDGNTVQSTTSPDMALHALWDGLVLKREADADAATVFRVHDPEQVEGETVERTVRIGTGPWIGSLGALRDDQGNPAQGWSVLGANQNRSVSMLAAEEALRLRSGGQETNDMRLVRPSSVPLPDRAVTYDGTRYWPLMIRKEQPKNLHTIRVTELKTTLPSTIERTKGPGSTEDFSDPVQPAATTKNVVTKKDFTRGAMVEKLRVDPARSDRAQIGPFIPGKPTAGETLVRLPLLSAWTLYYLHINLDTAPASDATFTLQVDNESSGTRTVASPLIAAGDRFVTMTIREPIAQYEVIVVAAPDPADVDMEGISIAAELVRNV